MLVVSDCVPLYQHFSYTELSILLIVTGLTAKGAERVQLLIGMLSSFLLEQQDSFDGSFLDGFTSDTSQSIVSVGNKLLDTMQAVFACFAILLRVQIIMLMDQSVRSSSTLSSEETIELGFRLFHKFITLNLVAPRMSGDDGGKGPRGKVKALDVVTKKRLMLMVRIACIFLFILLSYDTNLRDTNYFHLPPPS